MGIATEILLKVSSNLGQSLSRPLGDSSLYTREPFPAEGGGRGGHRPVIGIASNARRGGTEPAPYRKEGNTQRDRATNTQCWFEIYRAIPNLVSRKAKCPA